MIQLAVENMAVVRAAGLEGPELDPMKISIDWPVPLHVAEDNQEQDDAGKHISVRMLSFPTGSWCVLECLPS